MITALCLSHPNVAFCWICSLKTSLRSDFLYIAKHENHCVNTRKTEQEIMFSNSVYAYPTPLIPRGVGTLQLLLQTQILSTSCPKPRFSQLDNMKFFSSIRFSPVNRKLTLSLPIVVVAVIINRFASLFPVPSPDER